MEAKKVLLIVDMQNDFMPGGALPIEDGLKIVPNIVREAFSGYDLIIATRDFHPQTHLSFKEVGGDWPMHCIAGTEGAQLLPEIDMVADIILSKGTDPNKEAYSGFQGTTLSTILSSLQETGGPPAEVVVVGVATDVCVAATVFESNAMGYPTTMLLDCVAGVTQEGVEDTLLTMADTDITLRNRE